MINALHANIRHRFVHPERIGQVAVLAIDDLEKMPLDQMAYNGNKVYAVDNPLLVPTSNYSNGRKLVLTSILVLCLDTVANQERVQGKRRKLTRYVKDASSLPRSDMEDFVAGEEGARKEVEIVSTDRGGIPVVTIKAWSKKNNEHEPWSQPSSAVQLADDLLLLYKQLSEDRNKASKLHRLLFSYNNRNKAVPTLIITSDGASDQSVQNVATIISLAELLRKLDLDILEKWHYCPDHSKFNPAERENGTIKAAFKGGIISSGNGDREAMEDVKRKAAAALKGKTHCGEPIRAIPHHRDGAAEREGDRSVWELSIDAEELRRFAQERTKIGPWKTTNVPPETMAEWEQSEDTEELAFAALEERLRWAKYHMRYHALYGVVLAKCHAERLDKCGFCARYPWRGHDWDAARTTTEALVCKSRPACEGRFCDHRLTASYNALLDQMTAITPADGRTVRLCSVCRQSGHNKTTCPDRRARDAD
jgi:hypothetical protein